MLDINIDEDVYLDVVRIPQETDGKTAHAGVVKDSIVAIYRKRYEN